MPCCTVTPKVFLGFLTAIFWGAAGCLIFVGSLVYKEYRNFDELTEATYTLIPATILLGAGAFFFILGLIGCIGACKEQRCLLGVYFSLLLVILVGLVVTAILGYVYRHNIEAIAKDNLDSAFHKYGKNGSEVVTNEIDFMQTQLHCCGLENYTDWQDTYWHQHHPKQDYPDSCCPNRTCTATNVYNQGCYKLLKDQFLHHLAMIGGVAACFALIQIVGMVSACILICRRRTDTPYIGLASPEHLRV